MSTTSDNVKEVKKIALGSTQEKSLCLNYLISIESNATYDPELLKRVLPDPRSQSSPWKNLTELDYHGVALIIYHDK